MKKVIIRLLGLAILVAAGWSGYRFMQQMPERQEQIATAKVQQGDVVIRAYSRGEVRAVRSVSVTAPNLFGTVQVTQVAPMGAIAREKDLIVEYDDSERRASLEEAMISVQSVDETIKKAKADQAIRLSQDTVDLLKGRYDVRRSELDVQKNPILDAIEAKKNILRLEQTKRALAQLEADILSRIEQSNSQLAVYQEQRNRSLLDVSRELQRIALTKSLAPMAGLVALKQNRTGNFNFGQEMPDIREGDSLQPGMPVADILDLSEVEVWAKVGELDRANLREGQDAVLQLDAVPDKRFPGRIKAMSGTASSDVFSGDPSKKFDVIFSVDMRQLLAGLGVKQNEVDRIMASAAENARRAATAAAAPQAGGMMGGMFGGAPGGAPSGPAGMPSGMPGGQAAGAAGAPGVNQGGRAPQQAGGGRTPQAGGRGGQGNAPAAQTGLSAEDREKFMKLVQVVQTGNSDQRQKAQEEMTRMVAASGGGARAGRGGRGGAGFGNISVEELVKRGGGGQYTEEERNSAKLPMPPEEDSQIEVLLRPGLLSDVEITVERIPNAIHVPRQAVFQKNGKQTVFIQLKNRKFEAREVQVSKQSESMMVLTAGVKPGDIVALADPTADRSGKKGSGDKKSQANPMSGMGGGK